MPVVLVVLAGGTGACTDTTVVPELEPGEALILAVLDGEGRTTRAIWWSGAVDHLDVPSDGALVGFALPSDAFIDEDAVPRSIETLGVRVMSELPTHPESCGRCFSRADSVPQAMRRAESCPPPLFSRSLLLLGEATAEVIERAREDVRLDAPGACPCRVSARPGPADLHDLDLRPVAPEGGLWPVEQVAMTSSGTLGLFGEHLAIVATAGGRRIAERIEPFLLPGPVMAAAPIRDESFVVIAHDTSHEPNEQRVFLFDRQLQAMTPPVLPYRVQAALWHETADAVVLAGRSVGATSIPQITLCAADSLDRCFDLSAIADVPSGSVTALGTGESGLLLLEQFYRHLIAVEDLPAPGDIVQLAVLSASHGLIRVVDGSVRRWRREPYPSALSNRNLRLAASGRTVFACALAEGGVPAALLVDDGFLDNTRADPWIPLGLTRDDCVGLLPFDGGMQLIFRDDTTVLCSADDPTACTPGPGSPLMGDRLGAVERAAPGFDLSFAANRVRVRRAGTGAWTEVYGRTLPGDAILTIAASAQELVAFFRSGRIAVASLREASWALTPLSFELGARPIASTYDPVGRRFLVSVECASDGTGELRAVDLAAGTVEALDLFGAEPCVRIREVQYVAAGRTLTADEYGELHVLDQGGAVEPVEIEWDDAETVERETRPDGLLWRVISSAQGVAFVSGDGPALLRVDLLRAPWLATRIDMARPTQLAWNPLVPDNAPELRALAARCPDVVAIGSRGQQRATFEAGVAWRLEPPSEPPQPAPGLTPVVLVDEDYNAAARSALNSPTSLLPVGMIGGDPDWTVFYFKESLHRVGAGWHWRLKGVLITDGLELPDGRFVLSSDHGDLLLGERR